MTVTSIPSNYKSLSKFLRAQENLICEDVQLDKTQLKRMKHLGVKMTRQEWDRMLKDINANTNERYRNNYFTKQMRIQIIQQIIELERNINKERIINLNKVNDILQIFKLHDLNGNYNQKGFDNIHWSGSNKREQILELVNELPDSNALSTSNIDLIEEFDSTKEAVEVEIQRMRTVKKNLEMIRQIKEQLSNSESIIKLVTQNDEKTEKELKLELQRSLVLLSKLES